jgi:hypothetical protein
MEIWWSFVYNKRETIVRLPNSNQNHEVTCLKQLQVSIDCSVEYEYLKHEAKNSKKFSFSEAYASSQIYLLVCNTFSLNKPRLIRLLMVDYILFMNYGLTLLF